MKKLKLMIVIVLLFMLLTSCGSATMTQESLAKEIIKIEEEFKSYTINIVDVNVSKTFVLTYENKTTKSQFKYSFGLAKDSNEGLYVNTYTKTIEQNSNDIITYIYYDESKNYCSSSSGLLGPMTQEGSIEYNVFSSKYLKPELYSFNLDFTQLKEFSFVDNHTLTPSAKSEIVFNEEYQYIFKNGYVDVNIKNVSAEVTYRAGAGWEVEYLTIKGINAENEEIQINLFVEY